jgi:hypothetical protein
VPFLIRVYFSQKLSCEETQPRICLAGEEETAWQCASLQNVSMIPTLGSGDRRNLNLSLLWKPCQRMTAIPDE